MSCICRVGRWLIACWALPMPHRSECDRQPPPERNVLTGVCSLLLAAGGLRLTMDVALREWSAGLDCEHAPVCSKQSVGLGTKKTSLEPCFTLSRDDDELRGQGYETNWRVLLGRATLT